VYDIADSSVAIVGVNNDEGAGARLGEPGGQERRVRAGFGGAPMARTRRARRPEARRVVQKVKLTAGERGELRVRAAELGVSVPRLLVESALSGVETPGERRRLVAELFETRRLLATVANNVNQLARAANISGRLSESGRLERALVEVDALVAELRRLTGIRR
jgi:Bacterial mobilisation protein (MobC)